MAAPRQRPHEPLRDYYERLAGLFADVQAAMLHVGQKIREDEALSERGRGPQVGRSAIPDPEISPHAARLLNAIAGEGNEDVGASIESIQKAGVALGLEWSLEQIPHDLHRLSQQRLILRNSGGWFLTRRGWRAISTVT